MKILLSAMALAAAALFCVSCGENAPAKDKDTVTVGVSIPAADHGWTGGIVWWAEQAKKEWEQKDPKVKIIINLGFYLL